MTNVTERITSTGPGEQRPPSRNWSHVDRILLVCVLLLQTAMFAALLTKLNIFEETNELKTAGISKQSHHVGESARASSPGSPVDFVGSSSQPKAQMIAMEQGRGYRDQTRELFELLNLAGRRLSTISVPSMNGSRLNSRMSLMLNQALNDFEILEDFMDWDDGGWRSLSPSLAVDMRDFDDYYLVSCHMPGVTKKDLDERVWLNGRHLTIPEPSQCIRSDGGRVAVAHRVLLPGPIVEAKFVHARLTNDMLRIAIPKSGNYQVAKSLNRLL